MNVGTAMGLGLRLHCGGMNMGPLYTKHIYIYVGVNFQKKYQGIHADSTRTILRIRPPALA